MKGLRWWWVAVCALMGVVECVSAQAPLLPVAASYDAAGNLYYVDANRNQVFELPISGALTLVAGTGTQGFGGDGGASTAALLNAPRGIAIASDGTIYISDTGNQRIRKIVNGTISTVVGTGVAGFSGDGGAANAAQLRLPTALAVDGGGNVFICDTGNERIREIAAGNILTIAGTGVDGFSGDGGNARNAEIDGPEGVAVLANGRVVFSDTRNQRVRVIDSSGNIATLAGNGVAGFLGDGGAAVQARVRGPRGLSANGTAIYLADTDNQRVRLIDATGNISTVAGAGVQGTSADGSVAVSAMLNLPDAVAVGPSGVAIVDSGNGTIRLLAGGDLYVVVPVQSGRTVQVAVQVGASSVYGQGSMKASVTSSVVTPSGSVTLFDSGAMVESAGLAAGSATLSLGLLNAGVHQLQVQYSGDGVNAAASSAVNSVTVTPSPVSVTPNDASMVYGTLLPILSGTISGVLPRDVANVFVMFGVTANASSDAGSYPISAQLSGTASGNYATTLTRAALLTITQAPTATVFSAPSGSSYAGLPLILSAEIGSTSNGVPSGSVTFADNGVTVASGVVASGAASATYLSPLQGSHSLTASYSGDKNFAGSSSAVQSVTVASMPDFTLSVSTVSATVQGGLPAQYLFNIAPNGGAFTGLVSLNAQGMQPGATVTFSPATVVPGATGAEVTMTVQTVSLAWLRWPNVVLALLLPTFVTLRRRRCRWLLLAPFCMVISGCGARTVSTGEIARQSFTITVTGTGANLAGQVVRHNVNVTLVVE